jgi:hypothetical protein
MENLTRKDVVDLIKRYRGPLAGSSAYLVAHQLDGLLHTVSGLTAGHFLKALSPTTFGFAAHGLGYGDVGAAPAFVSAAANLFWATPNGAPGVPSLRAIVAADIPALSYDASGAAAAAVNGTANTLAMFTATHVVGNSIVTQPTAIALTFTPTAANNLTINAAISDADHSLILQVANTEIFRLPGLSLGGGLLISGSNRLKLRDNYRYLETGGTEGLYINDATASGFINFVLGQRAAGPLQFSGDTTNFITDYQGGAAAWIFKVASSEISRISSAGQIMYGSLATYYRDTDTYIKSNSTGVFYYSAYTSHNFYLPSLGCGEVSASFKIDVDSSAPRIGILSTSTAYYTYLRCGVQGADITYVFPTAAPTVNYQYLSSTTAGVWSWRTAAQTLADIGAVAGTGTQYYLPMWNNAGGTTLGNSLIQQNSAGTRVGVGIAPTATVDINGGLHVAGASYPSAGAGLEINYDGGVNYITGYNRTTPAYLAVSFNSLYTSFLNSGTEYMRLTGGKMCVGGWGSPVAGFDLVGIANGQSPFVMREVNLSGGLSLNATGGYSGFGLGVRWSGTQWIPMSVAPALFYKSPTQFVIYGDVGKTIGTAYTPTIRQTVDLATGNMTLTSPATLTISALTTAGILHNAVTTGLISSSLIVAADVTNNTLTNTQLANLVAVGTIPMGATYGLTASAITQAAGPFVGINCTGRTALDVNGSILTNWSESFIGTWYLDGSAFAMGQYFDVTNRVLLIYNKDADAADANPSIQFATGASQTTKMTITKSGLVGIGCAPTSMLRVAGPIALAAPQRLTTNYYNAAHPYVVAATDYALVFASTVPTAQYVTLPTGCTGRILSFQLIGTNNFNLIATNGSIIYRPGASSLTDELANPTTGHTCCVIEYDGTNWLMLSWG